MMMTLDTFKTYLQSKSPDVALDIAPSKTLPSYLRVVRRDRKRFSPRLMRALRSLAPNGSLENGACYHFLIGEGKLARGAFDVREKKIK